MNAADFELLAGIVRERAGIAIRADKGYLLESRLKPLAQRHGLNGLDELAERVRSRRDDRLAREITEAMTTNESLFFRDTRPFDVLRDRVLPGLMEARKGTRRLRIWCAACAAGQEPYSIAILLKEQAAAMSGWRVEITATDIAEGMIDKAKAGIYSQFEVQRGMPVNLLLKYFRQNGDRWQIDDSIRSMVTFKQGNLMQGPYNLGQFDVIFCRNVLIYFEPETKARVVAHVADSLAADGALFLGGTESVRGISDRVTPVPGVAGLYQNAKGAAALAPAK